MNVVEQEQVLSWCRNLVASLRDGGVWAIPRSGLVFRLDKGSKTLSLISGSVFDADFEATKQAFALIGWKVS